MFEDTINGLKYHVHDKVYYIDLVEDYYNTFKDNIIHIGYIVAIEYNIPNTSKRVDFMVLGRDEKDAAEDGIRMAAEAVAVAVSEGTAAAMNKFNGAGK